MKVCGYAIRRRTDAEALLFSHPIPLGIGYWFCCFFRTLCYYAYSDSIMDLRYSGENGYG